MGAAKRRKRQKDQQPVLEDGLEYWRTQPPTLDGVLGGFGNGTLPYVDALASRQLLLSVRPDLCTVHSALRRLDQPETPPRRTRALDLGAGIGRVTRDVLLPLLDGVILVEPIQMFLAKAQEICETWTGIAEGQKHISFIQEPLQAFDPCHIKLTSVNDASGTTAAQHTAEESSFDVIWIQWCLGHLNDEELVALLRRCKAALQQPQSGESLAGGFIFVKENCCIDEDGKPTSLFCSEDSSVTRSNRAWLEAFADSGLQVFRNEVQLGFPPGLYAVRTYVLR